jgi:hypothetical protein
VCVKAFAVARSFAVRVQATIVAAAASCIIGIVATFQHFFGKLVIKVGDFEILRAYCIFKPFQQFG